MEKKTVAVIFGGCSNEYDISLVSASAVIDNLDTDKYNIVMLGITRNGRWYRYFGDTQSIRDDGWYLDESNCVQAIITPDRFFHGVLELRNNEIRAIRLDAAFPVVHGKNGEDGSLQGLIQLAGIPTVGCSVLSSALCMDKDRAHKLVSLEGIRIPQSFTCRDSMNFQRIFDRADAIGYPLFVKPVNSGSSIGISKVYDEAALKSAVEDALCHDDRVIIEEAISGFEVGCAVMGNETLTIGELDEIELEGGFFDFVEKYSLKSSKIHMPARIDALTAQRLKETAAIIYRTLNCSGLARVDMFLTPDDEIYFNEVNTIPGFTAHSRFPNMMKGIGLNYTQILDRLIEDTLKDRSKAYVRS